MSKEKLVGVVIFGGLIILSSICQMFKLLFDINWYYDVLAHWPEWLIVCRYAFSWLQRGVGLVCGIGLFFYKDIFRKILIIWGIFTILTVYWKHPYSAFKEHVLYLDQLLHFDVQGISLELITLWAVIVHCVLDILFQSALIFYFTRSTVKAKFH